MLEVACCAPAMERTSITNVRGHDIGTQAGEKLRDSARIADASKEGVHPRRRNRGKKVAQIEVKHHFLSAMRCRIRCHGTARPIAMHGGVRWDCIQNPLQQASLNCFQAQFRYFQQTRPAGWLRQPPICVMSQGPGGDLGFAPLAVGEPIQLAYTQAQPFGQC